MLGIRKRPMAFARVKNREQPARFQVVGANKFNPSVKDFKKFTKGICDMQPVSTSDWMVLLSVFF